MVDDGDPVGEPVGLVQVLRRQQHGRPARDEPLDRVPEREPAARVEPRGRLVEEQHGRAGDQGGRQVEPAAHPAGVGPHEPAAGVREVELREQLPRAAARVAAAEVVEAADHLQVLEAGEVLVDRRVLAGEPDPLAEPRRLAEDVDARPPAPFPRRAASSVVRIRTAVVLPAPFGPSSPRTIPVSAVRSTPSRATTLP